MRGFVCLSRNGQTGSLTSTLTERVQQRRYLVLGKRFRLGTKEALINGIDDGQVFLRSSKPCRCWICAGAAGATGRRRKGKEVLVNRE